MTSGGEHTRTAIDQAGNHRASTRPSWSRLGEAGRLFLRGATVRTGWKVAVVVGTVLSVVNQGAVIAEGDAGWATWLRVGVNYLVPFLVSSYGFLSACQFRPGSVRAME